jgi:hypothetical protein
MRLENERRVELISFKFNDIPYNYMYKGTTPYRMNKDHILLITGPTGRSCASGVMKNVVFRLHLRVRGPALPSLGWI